MKNILGCRSVTAIFISLFLSACVTILSSTSLEQDARAVTVLITTPTGYGTGVLVSPDKVLTAKHLLLAEGALVYFYEGLAIPENAPLIGEVSWRSDNVDLALLSIPKVDISPVDLVCQTPEIGTSIFIIGHSGFGVGWAARYGKVAASNVNSRDTLIVYMTTSGGDSGSGIFDYNGKLVGILVARQISRSGNDGFSFIIPDLEICKELVDII